MRDGRITQAQIDELFTLAPALVAAETAALRAAAVEFEAAGENRRAGAMRARATVLSARGDLATPIELRVAAPTRTAHRHRSPSEFRQVVDAHAGVLAIMGYVEQVTGLTARWSGYLGLCNPADAGAMGFDGDLRIARQYLAPLAALGTAARTATRVRPAATRRAQLQSREAGTVIIHEAFHAASPFSQRDYLASTGSEEALAEILMALFYADAMKTLFGKTVAEAEPLDYPKFREPLERIANTLGVTRTDFAERAFYLGLLRRRTLAGRVGYLRRALLLAGVRTTQVEKLVNACLTAWKGEGGDADRTSTQRPPRRVAPTFAA
jgi:hypothetical protein